jgi:hypothetical protein
MVNGRKKIVTAPADGNCLFWAVCLAFLAAAEEEFQFQERLEELFFQKTEDEDEETSGCECFESFNES